jgi:hypothetical protein
VGTHFEGYTAGENPAKVECIRQIVTPLKPVLIQIISFYLNCHISLKLFCQEGFSSKWNPLPTTGQKEKKNPALAQQ